MSTVQDSDIAIWVCPHGYSADVLELAVGGPEPKAEGCATHGEPYIKRCPKSDCPSPVYHPSDLDANYHKPCRSQIPWAETRSAAARALMEHDPFNSNLLGTKKRDYAFENFVDKRYFRRENLPEPLSSQRELTPEPGQAPKGARYEQVRRLGDHATVADEPDRQSLRSSSRVSALNPPNGAALWSVRRVSAGWHSNLSTERSPLTRASSTRIKWPQRPPVMPIPKPGPGRSTWNYPREASFRLGRLGPGGAPGLDRPAKWSIASGKRPHA